MDTLDFYYDNMVDFLVLHSGATFETPEGDQTGAEILENLWLPYAPSGKIALKKLTTLQQKQKELLSTRRVKIDDTDAWEVKIANESNTAFLEMGMRLV